MQQTTFIAKIFIASSTCLGHYYTHHQELKNIIQTDAACGTWCLDLQVVGLHPANRTHKLQLHTRPAT